MRPCIVALLALVPATAHAQAGDFRSFSAMRPTLSDEITVAGTMDSPEGRYRVVDQRSTQQEHVYQIENCSLIRRPGRLRASMQGDRHMRCRVVEVSRTLECASCAPHALTFDDVVFARYVSPVTDENGSPVTANWYGHLAILGRRVRLLIEEDRFIVHDWHVSDPNMVIIEAPIRRVR